MNQRTACLALLLLASSSCREPEPPPVAARKPPPAPDAAAPAQLRPWYAVGKNGAVATAKREATDAALEILKAGGTAADAAAAAILALSVADHAKFHFGGEVTILAYDAASKSVEVIAGQGAAPRLATRERFARAGIPKEGALAATVPGALDAVVTLLDRHGRKSFAEVAKPTQDLLKKSGANWYWKLARTLRKLIDAEKKADGVRRSGLRRVSDEFYRGAIARDIDAWAQKSGALLRFADLATHATRVEEPMALEYRDYKIWKAGAWTQGPALLEALALIDRFGLEGMEPDSPRTLHLSIESLKLAFADRDTYLADPLFVDVPADGMIYPYYISLRSKLIDLQKASMKWQPGNPRDKKPTIDKPPQWATRFAKGNDTTTCVVVDKDGNVVAATPSGWAGVEAGETGVFLGTRLQSFNTFAGHPNVLEPGKRPRNTLTPTIVTRDGHPVYAISVAGGDQQDQVTLQLLLQLIDFKKLPDEAITAPRFSSEHLVGSFGQPQPRLGVVTMDAELMDKVGPALEALGHRVEKASTPIGEPVLLSIDPLRHIYIATGDPRTGREAGAY